MKRIFVPIVCGIFGCSNSIFASEKKVIFVKTSGGNEITKKSNSVVEPKIKTLTEQGLVNYLEGVYKFTKETIASIKYVCEDGKSASVFDITAGGVFDFGKGVNEFNKEFKEFIKSKDELIFIADPNIILKHHENIKFNVNGDDRWRDIIIHFDSGGTVKNLISEIINRYIDKDGKFDYKNLNKYKIKDIGKVISSIKVEGEAEVNLGIEDDIYEKIIEAGVDKKLNICITISADNIIENTDPNGKEDPNSPTKSGNKEGCCAGKGKCC